nr:DNA (cytosine-5)-methyltransferase DRM2-like [Aegilops tauschii subsp. strangulata]
MSEKDKKAPYDTGPPFFYYENVDQAPRRVWMTISRSLYDIQPEFVCSKHLCHLYVAARKRGYIHNLPTKNREPLLHLPPKAIFEAFPHYKKRWPSWDSRAELNCLRTSAASAKLTKWFKCALCSIGGPPTRSAKKYVINQCRKESLVWVGKNKVAPLDPQEIEYLLGFPKEHTRGRQHIPSRYCCLPLVNILIGDFVQGISKKDKKINSLVDNRLFSR